MKKESNVGRKAKTTTTTTIIIINTKKLNKITFREEKRGKKVKKI